MPNEHDARYERKWQDEFIDGIYISDFSDDSAFNAYEILKLPKEKVSSYVPKTFDKSEKLRILEELSLCENNRFRRAGVLLFANKPDLFIPGAYIKIGMFASNNTLIKESFIYGPIMKNITSSAKLIISDFVITDKVFFGLIRRDVTPIPMRVLREAIANAVIHKKYSSCNPILIKVLPDEIIINNHMILPNGWSVETFNHGKHTYRLNQRIVGVLEPTTLIEGWGTGIRSMNKLLTSVSPLPLREASYSILGDQLSVSLPNPTGILRSDVNYDKYELKEYERKIILYLDKNKKITRKQCGVLLSEIGIKDRQINNILADLVKKEIMVMIEAGPKTYYELKI